jgi:hypothetical protein
VWWALPSLTVAWLLMLVILVASVARVQLWELAPGSAEAVAPRMSFGEDATAYAARYQTDGEIMFVTALGSRLSLLDALAAWRDEDVTILTFSFGSCSKLMMVEPSVPGARRRHREF